MPSVTSKGQVTIPKEIRDKLGINPGDEVEFRETPEGYIIHRAAKENPFEKWRGVTETDRDVEQRIRELRGDR